MNGIIEEAGCLARGVMFASTLCVTRYTFSKAGFVTLAERRALQQIQMETTLLLATCNVHRGGLYGDMQKALSVSRSEAAGFVEGDVGLLRRAKSCGLPEGTLSRI
jgi:hypothetical protein